MPGQVAAKAALDADKEESEKFARFPSVTDCAPFHVKVENGFVRQEGIRAMSTEQ